jgi:hypothetical protein
MRNVRIHVDTDKQHCLFIAGWLAIGIPASFISVQQ